jgi:hypothetical protein
MKEVEKVWATVGEGLRMLSKGLDSLANRLDAIIQEQSSGRTARKKPTAAPRKRPAKARSKPKQKPQSATDMVYQAVKASRGGIDTAAIMQKTGFDRKKVQGIVQRLKKSGKITTVERGKYTAA